MQTRLGAINQKSTGCFGMQSTSSGKESTDTFPEFSIDDIRELRNDLPPFRRHSQEKMFDLILAEYDSWLWDPDIEKNGRYARRMKRRALEFHRELRRTMKELNQANQELLELDNLKASKLQMQERLDDLAPDAYEFRRLKEKINQNPAVAAAWKKVQTLMDMY